MTDRRAVLAAVMAAIGLPAMLPAAADIDLSVSVGRRDMYIGESVVMQVKLNGADDAGIRPDLSAITGCTIDALGSHSASHRSMRIINGRVTREAFFGRQYAYRLTPTKTGAVRTGPVRVTVKGRTVSATGPSIRVVGVEKQDWVELDVAASRESVLVEEPFTVTLTVRLRQLSGRFARQTPLNPSEPPVLTIPYLDEEQTGLTGGDVSRRLKGLLARGKAAGFAINEYTSRRDPFDSLFSFGSDPFRRTRARFALPRKQVTRGGKAYWEYTLGFEYVATDEGQYTFGPVLFKGPVVTAVDAQGQGSIRNVFAVGPAATVRVVPPPEEGRPATYVGVLGSNMTVAASLDAQTCNVGDPLQLSIRIAGEVNLDKLRPPSIWDQADLVRNFRVYQETLRADRDADGVSYSLTVRPTVAGTLELPPIPVSYYDATLRAYQTVSSAPIPVRVNQVDVLLPEYVLNVDTNAAAVSIGGAGEDVGPVAPLNMAAAGHAAMSLLGGATTVVVAAVGPAVCLLVAALLLCAHLVRRLSSGSRPRGALRRARSRLASLAGEALDEQEAHRRLAAILRRYVSERIADGRGGMTPQDCRRALRERGIAPELVAQFGDALDEHFNAGFVSVSHDGWDVGTEAERVSDLLARAEAGCRSAGRSGGGAL